MSELDKKEFKETVRKVDRLYDHLYANGFAQAVKDQQEDIREIREELHALNKSFAVFTAGRAETCPFRRSEKEEKRQKVLLAGVMFAGLSSTGALVTLAFRIAGSL